MPKYSTTIQATMTRVIVFEAPDMEAARKMAINGTYDFKVPEDWSLLEDKADLPLTEEVTEEVPEPVPCLQVVNEVFQLVPVPVPAVPAKKTKVKAAPLFLTLENAFCSVNIDVTGKSISGNDLTDSNNEPAFYNTSLRGLAKAAADLKDRWTDTTTLSQAQAILRENGLKTRYYCRMD